MSTPVWLLAQVVKVWDFLVGIVVFHSLGLVIILPAVSSPIDSGVMSSSSRSYTCEDPSPVRVAACAEAPQAMASSGLMDVLGSLSLKSSRIMACTFGVRVKPPTRTSSCTFRLSMSLSRRPFSTGTMELRK